MQRLPSMQINKLGTSFLSEVSGKSADFFKTLQSGEKIQVEVVDVTPGKLTLKTNDGQLIQAEFSGEPVVMQGDLLELAMEHKTTGQVRLRMTAINGQPIQLEVGEIQIKLMNLGIEPTEANARAAEFLMERGLLPTSERISILLNIAEQFPQTPSGVVFFMAANGVEANAENVTTITQWFDDPLPLSDRLTQLQFLIGELFKDSGTITNSFLQNFFLTVDKTVQGVEWSNGFLNTSQFHGLATKLQGLSAQEAQTLISEYLSKTSIPENQKPQVMELLLLAHKSASETIDLSVVPKLESGDVSKQAVLSELANRFRAEENTEGKGTGEKVSTQQSMAFTEHISNPVNRDIGASNHNAIAQEFRQLMGELDKFVVSIKGEVVSDAERLQKALQRQPELADGIKSSLIRLNGETSYISQKAGDITAQVRLGNQLENFYYCQVPFEINQKQKNAELYVFEKKQNTDHAEKTNTTILIGLDTEHMGRVEAVLRSEEKLSIELRLQSESVLNYFESEKQELNTALEKDAFSVKEIRLTLLREKTTPINAMKTMDMQEHVSFQSVDIII